LELREELHARIDLLALRPRGARTFAEHGQGSDGADDELMAHLRDCSACRLLGERLVAALSSLDARRSAPHELDGRVVAALGGGHRQERGVRALVRVLTRRPAPGGLEGNVERSLQGDSETLRPTLARVLSSRVAAPAVLERLVAEEIQDPAKSTARRFVGFLRRAQAPKELEQGLDPRRSRRMQVSLTVAATLLAALFLMRPQGERSYSFRVARPTSVAELSPMARSLLDAATAGALSSRLRLEDKGAAE
jgi:hypothetical protein